MIGKNLPALHEAQVLKESNSARTSFRSVRVSFFSASKWIGTCWAERLLLAGFPIGITLAKPRRRDILLSILKTSSEPILDSGDRFGRPFGSESANLGKNVRLFSIRGGPKAAQLACITVKSGLRFRSNRIRKLRHLSRPSARKASKAPSTIET